MYNHIYAPVYKSLCAPKSIQRLGGSPPPYQPTSLRVAPRHVLTPNPPAASLHIVPEAVGNTVVSDHIVYSDDLKFPTRMTNLWDNYTK